MSVLNFIIMKSTNMFYQSFGGSDASASENHLRQRMRLERVHSVNSVISLKQSQAEILQQEMDLPGVTVVVSMRAAQGIALVDCADAVWCVHLSLLSHVIIIMSVFLECLSM